MGRLVMQSLCEPAWGVAGDDEGPGCEEVAWQAAARSLFELRCALQDKRCVAMVTVQAGACVLVVRIRTVIGMLPVLIRQVDIKRVQRYG